MISDLSADPHRQHRVQFDWTINLGHVLTMATFVALGVSTYYSLDRRITKQEDLAPFVATAREEKDRLFQKSLNDLSADLKDVKGSVDKLTITVQVQNAVNTAGKK